MKTRLLIFLIVIILLTDLAYFYPKLTSYFSYETYEKQPANITRVIDGDTFDSEIGKIRLLGINSPEKKQPFYEEALAFLKQYEGKQVELELHGKDKYQRTLAYVYFDNKLINQQLLAEGLANLYYYGKDSYYEKMRKAEQNARKNQAGLWKKSSYYTCIELVKLTYNEGEKRCTNNEQIIIKNKCSDMDVSFKDDANHIFNLKIENGIFSKNFSCIWNDDGDSLFIRDKSGLLLYHHY